MQPIIEPVDAFMTVRPFSQTEMSEGGIVIPEEARCNEQWGEVLAVGPGSLNQHTGERITMDFAPGDFCIWNKHDGSEIEIKGHKCFIINRHRSVLARLRWPEAGKGI